MTPGRSGRPGAALIALLVIVVVTAGWWALALWPVGTAEPEWLVRTRSACFGSERGGLPGTSGWILLIGEPVGMLGILVAAWGGALLDDLRRLRGDRRWAAAGLAVVLVATAGAWTLGVRVARAAGRTTERRAVAPGMPARFDADLSAIALTDQRGARWSAPVTAGKPVMLTFAFGHCATMCPTVVRDLLAARRATHRPDVTLVVMTLDPWRDTPERLEGLAAHWELEPGDRVLSGSVAEVEATLDRLGIGRRRDPQTGDIVHGGTVLLLDPRGRVAWRLDGGWGRVRELLGNL
ncbi:MAG: SCO family protein [Gemmatimonadetes bacterium]|nr:SCO family protein [Gemmatimonadota bacterium]